MTEPTLMHDIQTLIHSQPPPAEVLEAVGALQPYDVSEALRELDHDEQLRLVALLPTEAAAAALEYLEPELQYRILDHLDEAVAASLLQEISSDVVVDLLLAIHPRQAAQLKGWLPEAYRRQLDTLMTFPENTAGSLATVDYVAVREGWTVQQTLDHIRKVGREAEIVSYAYVVNARGQLLDVVSLRELILAEPAQPLAAVTNNYVISVRADTDQEEAARILSQYDLVALPVVDDQNRLIGIITVDDLVDVIQEEATEDIHRLGGSEPLTESYFNTPVWVLVRKRIVWLLVLFLAGAYTSTVLQYFEHTLAEVVALAFFIPLLIGTGGNTGSQVVTTLVRGLSVGEVQFQDMARVLGRETAAGLAIGLVMGLATWVRAAIMGVGMEIGPVVTITALFIVLWASTISAVLPLVLHRLRVDPAVVSGPLITTLVDGTGLFIYFSVAQILLGTG